MGVKSVPNEAPVKVDFQRASLSKGMLHENAAILTAEIRLDSYAKNKTREELQRLQKAQKNQERLEEASFQIRKLGAQLKYHVVPTTGMTALKGAKNADRRPLFADLNRYIRLRLDAKAIRLEVFGSKDANLDRPFPYYFRVEKCEPYQNIYITIKRASKNAPIKREADKILKGLR